MEQLVLTAEEVEAQLIHPSLEEMVGLTQILFHNWLVAVVAVLDSLELQVHLQGFMVEAEVDQVQMLPKELEQAVQAHKELSS